jgi:PST family polysaccharide transporter
MGIGGSKFIAGLFHQSQLAPIIRWLSLSFILAGLSSTQQAILRRRLAFKELAMRSVFSIITGGVVGIVLAFFGFGAWSLVAQNLVTVSVGVVVLWSVSLWRPSFHFSKKHFRDLLSFGFNIIGINLLNFLNRHADDLLIGYFLGPTMLGFYTIAYKLLVVMTDLLTSVTNAVAFPTFSRLQNDPERMRRAFLQAIHYTSLISFPAFIGVALVAPELIVTFFGPQWTLSIHVIRVLAFIGILHSIFYFHGSIVIARGRPSWRLGITFLNAVSNVFAFALAVRWGIVAVAAAYVLRGYVLAPLEVWMVKKVADIDIHQYLSQFTKPVLGSLSMSMAILGLRLALDNVFGLYARLSVYMFVGILIYILTVYVLEPPFWSRMFRIARSGFTR